MAKTYKLKSPLEVMDSTKGDFVESFELIVDFKGLQGHATLRKMQDTIFTAFKQQSDNQKGNNSPASEKADNSTFTAEDLSTVLQVTGNSEKIFTQIMKALETSATINGNLFTKDIQNQIENHADFDGIFDMVVRDFLSEKVIKMMNNI